LLAHERGVLAPSDRTYQKVESLAHQQVASLAPFHRAAVDNQYRLYTRVASQDSPSQIANLSDFVKLQKVHVVAGEFQFTRIFWIPNGAMDFVLVQKDSNVGK
jgi:hypothetical protein